MKIKSTQLNHNTYSFLHWSKIDKTYSGAVIKVLDEIKATRSFYNYREGQIDEAHLRETKEKAKAFKKLTDKKGMVTMEVQLGQKYKGKSVQEVRKIYTEGETGMGIYELGCILLANPKILQKYEDLWIDCPGDEFDDPGSGVRFVRAPCLRFHGRLGFGTGRSGFPHDGFGSASWFLPKQLGTRKLESFETSSLDLPKILIINGITYRKDE